jgi:hypothetical protein
MSNIIHFNPKALNYKIGQTVCWKDGNNNTCCGLVVNITFKGVEVKPIADDILHIEYEQLIPKNK